jgi:hypothetical protein
MPALQPRLLILIALSVPCFADSMSAFAQASEGFCPTVKSTGVSSAVADVGLCDVGGSITSFTHADATVSGQTFTGNTRSLGDDSIATAEGIFDFTITPTNLLSTAEVDVFGNIAAVLSLHASSSFLASLQMGFLPPETQTLIFYPPVTIDSFPCCTDASGHASFFLAGLTPGVPVDVQLVFGLTSEIQESEQDVHATGRYSVTLVPEPSTLLLLITSAAMALVLFRLRRAT